ncbi:MAG: hypothetical protein IT285_12245 [Bdellovibrionales bacterium]|nr:hypothetical protein [Bdellovibrionales bacterium]
MTRVFAKAYFLAFLALAVGSWSLRARLTRPEAAAEAKQPSAFQTLEEIEKQVREQSIQVVASPEARLYLEKDFEGLKKRYLEDKMARHRIVEAISAGIHLLDRGRLDAWSDEDHARLLELALGVVWDRKDHFTGRDAKAVSLALRLASKLRDPREGSQSRERVLELLQSGHHAEIRTGALGVVSRWVPLPAPAADEIRARMLSREHSEARTGLGFIPQVRDDRARVALLKDLAGSYGKILEPMRPLALKIWADYRRLTGASPEAALRKAMERTEDEWIDAAVYAIERGVPGDHAEYLNRLWSTAADHDVILKARLQRLLGRVPAAKAPDPKKAPNNASGGSK